MAKKKIFKDDGVTEDFDAEALEPEETSADAGNVADLLKDNDAGKTDAGAAAPSDESKGSDASTSGGESTTGEAAPSEAAEAPAEQPPLEAPHDEAKPAVEAAPEACDGLKEAANLVLPALNKFHAIEAEIHKLEDEAKNRLSFARQKAIEFVSALETLFKRG